MTSDRSRTRRILGIVFVTVFLDLVGFGILIPIQPFYAEHFGARPALVTLLSASFSLVQFLFAPVLGRVSDRIGRRPVMLATIAINALGYALFGLAQSLAMLFVARIISGFGSANLGTAQAIIADSTSPETRAKGMGLIGAAFGLGFILGPAIGGFFGQYGLAVPAYAASAFSAANFIFAFFRLPETGSGTGLASADARPGAGARMTRWTAMGQLMQKEAVPQLFWIFFVGALAFSLMEQALGLYIERVWVLPDGVGRSSPDQLRQAAGMTAWFLVAAGVSLTLTQGLLIGPMARRFGERKLVRTGTLLMAVAFLLIPVLAGLKVFPLFLSLAPMIAIGSGLTNPSLSSLLSQTTDQKSLGGTLGLGQSLASLGRVVGPSIAGGLFELRPGMPFLTGSLLMATCVFMAFTITRKRAAEVRRVESRPA